MFFFIVSEDPELRLSFPCFQTERMEKELSGRRSEENGLPQKASVENPDPDPAFQENPDPGL